MLPVLKTRNEVEFSSPRGALDFLENRVVQRFTVVARDLRCDEGGTLSHRGSCPMEPLQSVPLSDVALQQLDALAQIPTRFAAELNPPLHAANLNQLLAERLSPVTVLVEHDGDEPERQHVAAVVVGNSLGIDDVPVLRALDRRGLGAIVTLRPGVMEARFGTGVSVNALGDDAFNLSGTLRNDHWVSVRARAKPACEFGVYLERLVCSNGHISRRVLAEGRLLAWCVRADLDRFLNAQIDRVLEFPARVLPAAIQIMAESIPEEGERVMIESQLARYVGRIRAKEVLADAISTYDHMNAVTQTAHSVTRADYRRALHVMGGGMLDRFLDQAA